MSLTAGEQRKEHQNDRWCVHGFYAPEVNAHFIYTALDSDDRGTMWAYRFKRAAE